MIRVLIADDSATTRHFLYKILTEGGLIEVVGQACNGQEAVAMARDLKPDVVTMDIIMPVLNGVDATAKIMATNPIPVIMVSALEDVRRSSISMEALNNGALAILALPPLDSPDLNVLASHIRETVVNVTKVKTVRLQRGRAYVNNPTTKNALSKPNRTVVDLLSTHKKLEIVCMAGSVGGPQALAAILGELPTNFPLPILITQHMSKGFTGDLANWLNDQTSLKVKLAKDGELLSKGTCFVAPDDVHLATRGRSAIWLSTASPQKGFRPAASFMFEQTAKTFGDRSIAVILTGMGSDGLTGLKVQKEQGGIIIAQDEATSVVYGMPKAAVENGLTDMVLPLDGIGAALNALTQKL